MLQRNRVYSLIIGDATKGEGVEIVNQLNVTFDISKSSNNKDKTNSASIEIYNLSDEHEALISKSAYPYASFSAGYLDTGGAKLLFSGQVTAVITRKSGADRVTQIQMGAKYTELNHDVMSQLVAPGRTVKDVAEDIRKAIPGVSRGVFNGTNLSNQVIYGYPLMGTPREMMDELAEKFQLDWQIDGDVLYVHNNDRASTENFNEAYVISRYTGLIDNAYRVSGDVRRSKKDIAKKSGVQFKCLLNPDIKAGSIIKLEDTIIQGFFKVVDIRHTGGWREQGWYTECKVQVLEKVSVN